MLKAIVHRLDPPGQACARIVARHHLANRGKTVSYTLSSGFRADLDLSDITIHKSVGALDLSELTRVISEKQGTCAGGNVKVEQTCDGIRLYGERERDPEVLALGAEVSSRLDSLRDELTILPDPLARISTRRTTVRQLFSEAGERAAKMVLGDAPATGLAIVAVGSYNHAPLLRSDFDFLLLFENSDRYVPALAVLSLVERIFALTSLDASNIVRVNSGGRFEVLSMEAFSEKGFSLFPRSLSIKMALSDCTFLSGDRAFFERSRELVLETWGRSGVSRLDGARLHRIIGNAEQTAARDLRQKARLIEKVLTNALILAKVRSGIRGETAPDFGTLVEALLDRGIVDRRRASQISEDLAISRVACESLGEGRLSDLPPARLPEGIANLKQLEEVLSRHVGSAMSFFTSELKRSRIARSNIRLMKAALDLGRWLGGLKQRYWNQGRRVRPTIHSSG